MNWQKKIGFYLNFFREKKHKLAVDIKKRPAFYSYIGVVLLIAFFLRTYRTSDLLGFYYDQGRDALKIWDLWHKGDLMFIGPVTGLAGIFLGPFYYYLITPFYLLGGGNPLYPAYFLAFLATIAIGVLFYLGTILHSKQTGFIAVIVASFSYYMILAARWLSNPTPILLTSVLLFLSLYRIANNASQNWWLAVSFLVGLSMHFESASAVFYIPIVGLFFLWRVWNYFLSQKKQKLPSMKIAIFSSLVFLSTLVPQIAFNFANDNLLFDNFQKVIVKNESFRAPNELVITKRLNFFFGALKSKLFPLSGGYANLFSIVSLLGLAYSFPKLKKNKSLTLFLIFLGVPLVGYVFFQGNYGNIYDYYLTGYYLPMILLFAIGIGELWQKKGGKIVVLVFFLIFLIENLTVAKNYFKNDLSGKNHISLGNEIKAVDWIYQDAAFLQEFNVDIYVPPVIPHAYDYLLLWRGNKLCGVDMCGYEQDERTAIVYTLIEVDPPHPERLTAWLEKYKSTTIVDRQVRFGGITVQRRIRLN